MRATSWWAACGGYGRASTVARSPARSSQDSSTGSAAAAGRAPPRQIWRDAMVELEFSVLDIAPEPYAAAPQLTARLRIQEQSGAAVHAMALRCQVPTLTQR